MDSLYLLVHIRRNINLFRAKRAHYPGIWLCWNWNVILIPRRNIRVDNIIALRHSIRCISQPKQPTLLNTYLHHRHCERDRCGFESIPEITACGDGLDG